LTDDAGGRKPTDLPELEIDAFQEMDGGIELTPDQIKGRNTWNLWSGGDEQFWDRIAREGYGLFDLLKTLDSRHRGTRFREMGLINQPGFRSATKPDEYGLWLDEAVKGEPPGIDVTVYGRPSGVMGFRIFKNPDFHGDAIKNWDSKRFYDDAEYAAQPDLVRPYRVGVACGACHIAFHPCRPPEDPENPQLENLASAIGNQYIREGRVFAHNVRDGGFFWEILKAQPPGTSDTSRIATDHINNPNAINPIFDLESRLKVMQEEDLEDETLVLPATNRRMEVPHVLKDGADSVGIGGATLRVYVNIGMYSQHWLQQHNPLIGFRQQKPFSIETAQKNSVYWLATQQKFQNVAKFFKRLKPYRLEDAPEGRELFMTKDDVVLKRGAIVFAEECVRCHSSKRPPEGVEAEEWFRQEIVKSDFREDNFLSDEQRYPVTELQTNAARACGTNAKQGHIWQNFSSKTYKSLPQVGQIQIWNPYLDRMENFQISGGGPGYYRTPSLISLWSSAPFFHNNALGKFTGDPSVSGRMTAFNDAVQKLLWPTKRLGKASIWRTSRESNLEIQSAVIPEPLRSLLKGYVDADGYFRLGIVPEGTPINLLTNLDPNMDPKKFLAICLKLRKVLVEIKLKRLDSAAAHKMMKEELAPELFKASTCPDLIEDRGHFFGTDLSDDDKLALIEYLKLL
jgi:hypothetical protein